jgi:hypothetical protein
VRRYRCHWMTQQQKSKTFPGCVTAWRKCKGRARTDIYDNRSFCSEMNTSIYWTRMSFTYEGHGGFCLPSTYDATSKLLCGFRQTEVICEHSKFLKRNSISLYLANINPALYYIKTQPDFVIKFHPAKNEHQYNIMFKYSSNINNCNLKRL